MIKDSENSIHLLNLERNNTKCAFKGGYIRHSLKKLSLILLTIIIRKFDCKNY